MGGVVFEGGGVDVVDDFGVGVVVVVEELE